MKKFLFLVLIISSSVLQITAQESSTTQTAIQKGDFVIDAYYGYTTPGLFINGIRNLEGDNNVAGNPYNPSTSIVGPVGIRFQKMVTSNFGVGLDLNYEEKYGSWTSANLTGTDSNFNPIYTETKGSYRVTRIKAMIRTSWEFAITEDFTANWANSIGYKGGDRILIDPNGVLGSSFTGNLIPVAFRTALGMRYFLTDHIALNTEIGFFGAGLVTGGITIKP